MKYRKLGRSNIKVSEIGFGAWTIGLDWWGKKIDDDEAKRMLKKAFDLGINFFETADMYGKGKSEKIIGEAFKDMRNEIVLSSKWGYDMYSYDQVRDSEIPQKHNSEFLDFALKRSLERLQTDYMDVYSLHNPRIESIKDDRLFEALDNLVSTGKIKSHGVALGPAIGWEEEGIYAINNRNITCLQTVYNILEQDPGRLFFKNILRINSDNNKPVDTSIHNLYDDYDIGILIRVPDASGVLTGKVNENTVFSQNDHRSHRKKEWIIEAMKKIDKMKYIANSRGWSITELAIKFILSQKPVSVVLPTVTDLEEIEKFANISDGNYLNSSELEQINQLYENNFYVQAQ